VDRLWSPWRYQYLNSDPAGEKRSGECVFCDLLSDPRPDAEKLILYHGDFNFVVLNLFPYTSGHLMIVPFEHKALLTETTLEHLHEMMDLTRRAQAALSSVYKPDGFNVGMNLGSAAGAGVAGHIHMHVLPRWIGDANFVTTVGETRVLPESLDQTFQKLKPAFL
jgi:ATP adenylyltransferase